MNSIYIFSSETAEPEGLAALGLDWKILLFQAITFLLVFLFFKKFVINKIYAIIDARDQEIKKGLDDALKAQKELATAQDEIDKILSEARDQAEMIVSSAKKESAEVVKSAEEKAVKRSEAIVADAQSKLAVDVQKAKRELESETVRLISEVAETILREKLTPEKDQDLITRELEKRRAK